MPKTLYLGISPCPNDTFIFFALIHGKIGLPSLRFETALADVQQLNEAALLGTFDVVKVSAAVYARLKESYVLLRSGGALGWGCGPLLVARTPVGTPELAHACIAVPGSLTTANRLLQLHGFHSGRVLIKRYDEILPAVAHGEAEAGLVIHEGRFTYHRYGLHHVLDLGAWWEQRTGLPLPLGCILARKDLGRETHLALEEAIRRSLDYAQGHPEEAAPYVRSLAQEMEEATIQEHIDTFVTSYSRDLGPDGLRAVEMLTAAV